MATPTVAELIWDALQLQIDTLSQRVGNLEIRTERAEVSDGIPAYLFADLPTAANGGLGDNVGFTTMAWVTNGRKSGEGAGAGTGVLAYWDATSLSWKGVRSEVDVTA